MRIKAISLHQPYAGLIAAGIKTLETRPWPTSYRGELFIFSTQKYHPVPPNGVLLPDEMPRGVSLCRVRLVHSRPMVRADETAACYPYSPDLWVFELTDLTPIRQIPVKGWMKIYSYDLPDDICDLAT